MSDEDEIAANEARLRQLTDTFALVASQYLPHNLKHLRVCTTHSDNGSRQLEDLGAIPDLAAGALSEIWSAYCDQSSLPKGPLIVPVPRTASSKSRQIMEWLSREARPLSKIVFTMEQVENSCDLFVQLLKLHQW